MPELTSIEIDAVSGAGRAGSLGDAFAEGSALAAITGDEPLALFLGGAAIGVFTYDALVSTS